MRVTDQRVMLLRQRKTIRNRLPLKQRSQRLRSPTRFLNNPAPESRRRNLRSNCAWRATWPREARRRRGRWSRFLRQKRLSERGRLQRRGLKPRRKRSARKLRRKNWRKKGGGRGGYLGGRRPRLASIGTKGNGVRLGVKPTWILGYALRSIVLDYRQHPKEIFQLAGRIADSPLFSLCNGR